MNTFSRLVLFVLPVFLTSFNANCFASDMSVSDAYARAVPEGQTNSAAFMVLSNAGKQGRSLVSAKSTISSTVELHTHKMEDGMMRMRKVDKIDVSAGGKTELKPGGLHVMFIGLHKQLKTGDNIDLELIFDNGESVKLSVPVRQVAGMKKMEHMKKHSN